jgi:hypothetical protein
VNSPQKLKLNSNSNISNELGTRRNNNEDFSNIFPIYNPPELSPVSISLISELISLNFLELIQKLIIQFIPKVFFIIFILFAIKINLFFRNLQNIFFFFIPV